MATNIDERIVAAKFDASDFEKGVDKTLKKLDELKKSLDLKEATKGVKEFAEKTEVSTNSISSSLEKLTNRFTSFTGMIKQKILSGLADEVAGVFFKMEQSVKNFISGISTQQISAGMQKYQSTLTSVRQMVNAGQNEEKVYTVLDRLRTYSDETSYSFEQMAEAMSKMVNAGVDIDEAAKSVEGIANACANAGINATEAQRAFYNLSQAYSKGKLEYTDYRSLELLNMTTAEFKDQMLEAAVAVGTLEKKTDKAGKTIYKTTKKTEKAGKEINKENLTDMLRYGFMNKEAMNQVFGKNYWMEIIDREELEKLRKELGEEEFEKRFGKIASKAYQAAYEARSFLDVINAIKDAVSSGWSKTFEHLFGKLNAAKDFFTSLANSELADVIYKLGEYRNAILEAWNVKLPNGEGSGGTSFREMIISITDSLGLLFKAIFNIFNGFDELEEDGETGQKTLKSLGDRLNDVTVKVRNAAYDFNKWLNSSTTVNGPTRIEMIAQAFKNLGAILSIAGKVISVAFYGIQKVFKLLSPILDGVLVLFNKITEPLATFKDSTTAFTDMQYTIDNIYTTLKPVADVLGKIIGFLGEVGAFFVSMALDTVAANISFVSDAIGFLLELLTGSSAQKAADEKGVIGKLRDDFENIKTTCKEALSAVKEFFAAVISDLRKLFGLTEDKDQEGGVFEGITNFFETNEFVKNVKAWFDQAIADIKEFIKSIPSRLMKIGENIYDIVYKLFFKQETRYNGASLETETVLTPLGEWVVKVTDGIKKWFSELPDKIIKGIGIVGNWIDKVFDWIFGEKVVEQKAVGKDKNIKAVAHDFVAKEKSGFSKWLDTAIEEIKKFVSLIPDYIKKAFSKIGSFVTKAADVIDEFLFGKKVLKTKTKSVGKNKSFKSVAVDLIEREKSGFSKWLDMVLKELKKFIAKIPEYIKKGIKGAGDVISTIIGALFGKKDGKDVTNKDVEKRLEKPFLGINLSNILNTIADIGKTLLNQIARIFTGTDDAEFNANFFAEAIANGITWIKEKAQIALDAVLDFLASLPTKIADLLTGKTEENKKESGPIGKAITGFGIAIGDFLTITLPDAILKFINNAVDAIGDIWDKLYNGIINAAGTASKDSEKQVVEELDAVSGAAPKLSGWQRFVNKLGDTITHIFDELPTWIAKGIDMAIASIDGIISNLGKWLGNIGTEMADSTKKKSGDEEPELVKVIKNIGERIAKIFTETIPGFISDAWKTISEKGSEIWNGISTIFTGEAPKSELAQGVHDFGKEIYRIITEDIPGYIKKAFDYISNLFNKKDQTSVVKSNGSGKLFNIAGEFGEEYSESFKKAEKQMKSDNPEKSFFESIGERLLSFFSSIGPTIMNGLASALNWISDIATIIIDALTGKKSIGEQIEDAYGKEKPELKEALNNIGESLKRFFLETIPKLIGSAIGALAKKAPEWFGNLFGAISSAEAEAAEDAGFDGKGGGVNFEGKKVGIEAGANGVLQIIKDIYNSLSSFIGENKHFLEIAAIIIAVTLMLSKLSDLFGMADDLEEGARAIKWTAITLAVVAISGILSFISQIVGSGDEEKIAAFERIIDKIGNVMLAIVGILGVSALGKLFDALGEKWGNDESSSFNLKESLLGKLSDAFGSFLTTLGIGTAGNIVAGMTTTTLSQSMETLGSAFEILGSEVGETIKMIEPLVNDMASMNGDLTSAIEAAKKLRTLFSTFYGAFDALYAEAKENYEKRRNSTDLEEPTINEFFDNLFTRVELFNELAGFIKMLSQALNNFSEIQDVDAKMDELASVLTNNKFKDFLTRMLNVLKQSFDASKLSAKELGVQNYLVPRYTSGVSVGLEILSSALSIFADGISGFEPSTVDAFDKTLDVFQKLSDAFDETQGKVGWVKRYIEGDSSLSAIGTEIKLFGSSIKSFYDSISWLKGFEEDKVTETETKINAVIGLAQRFAIAMDGLEYYKGSRDFIKDLSELLPGYGEALSQFLISLNRGFEMEGGGYLTSDRIEMLVRSTEGFASIINAVNGLSTLMKNAYGGMSLSELITKMFGDGIEDNRQLTDINRLATLMTAFDIAIMKVMETEEFVEEYKTIGSNIAQKLFEGIQSAFDEDPSLQLKITPVLKLDDTTKMGLRKQLTESLSFNGRDLFNSVSGANTQTDTDRVTWTLLKEELSNITSAIEGGPKNALTGSDLITAFAGMDMVLDSGRLVGGLAGPIDERIGRKIWYLTRGNAVHD